MNEFSIVIRCTAFAFSLLGIVLVLTKNTSLSDLIYITGLIAGFALTAYQASWIKSMWLEDLVLLINFGLVMFIHPIYVREKHEKEKENK